MTYVYVLVSSIEDLYYEEALMSLYSLRLYMPKAKVYVLTDNKSYESFSATCGRGALEPLATKVVSIDFDDDIDKVTRSRLIKTSIPEYIDDDFLYIDCDTIILAELSSIEDTKYNTAGVLDGHVLLDKHIHRRTFLNRDKRLGFKGTIAAGYNINGGLIYAKKGQESRELFRQWNRLWRYSAQVKHDKHDQSALNEANRLTGLKMGLLDGIWNCQPSHGGLEYLGEAKIIHYYSSELNSSTYVPYYKLGDPSIENRIKKEGAIPEDIKAMIRKGRYAFNSVHILSDSRLVSVMQSPLVFTLADIKAKLPLLYSAMEGTMGAIRSLAKALRSIVRKG